MRTGTNFQRIATDEFNAKAKREAFATARKQAFTQFHSALIAAGVADANARAMAQKYLELPEMIQLGTLKFSDSRKAESVKVAITNLWVALDLGQPNFAPFDFEAERNRKFEGYIQFPG
ncbi:MAG TPA: hypothetical protein VEF04_13035 [Blastocatellia bacterium]|nr:hypothetical protein [Blastocatellia bacterium]